MDFFFLATVGCEAIMKVSTMAYLTNLEDLTFEKIIQIIRRNMRPPKRFAVAERTKITSTFVAKLRKLIEHDLLEHILPGSSKWASPIVVLRKSDGNIRISGDYKRGVNHKVCSDSYLIPNVEVAIHVLAGMSVFTKIDLKTAYHQIPIDDNVKEVTTINIPIGLVKWRRMPYGIKNIKRHISKGHQTGSK